MTYQFTNNAATTLASGITNIATSLTVATGTGALFPTPSGAQYFLATLVNAAGTTREIVKVTARSTDTFTITRAQEGTSAVAWNTGDKVELRITAGELTNFGQLDSTNTWAAAQTFSVQPTLTVALSIANGGTNSTATPTAGGAGYGTGTAHAYTAAGTTGQVLTSQGASAPIWSAPVVGLNGLTVFTASGTFTIPTGVTKVKVSIVGGGGASCDTSTSGTGGAGGSSSISSGTQTITTFTATGGAGGLAGTSGPQIAANGTCAASDIPFGYAYTFAAGSVGYTCGSLETHGWTTSAVPLLFGSRGAGGYISAASNNGSGVPVYYQPGGAGGQGVKFFTGWTPGNTITVTVGAGGTITAGGSNGTAGIVVFEY